MRNRILLFFLLLPLRGLFAQFYAGSGATVTVTSGTTLYTAGDVTVSSGSTLSNAGTVQLTGNLSCPGTIPAMNNLIFSGTTGQNYQGAALQAANVTISNPAGLTLSAPVTVTGATTFTSGLITSAVASPLIYGSGATTGTVTDASHVNGPVQYNGLGAFTYPVGDASHYRAVGVNLGGNGSGMTATYTNGTAPSAPMNTPLQAVSQFEYWTLTPVSTASGTVTLTWDASKTSTGIPPGTADLSPLQVAHLTGGNWQTEGGTATGTASSGSITSANTISSWSPFALGTTNSSLIPLPLRFLDIGASLQADGSRLVDWKSGEESQLKDYTVERSLDGKQFDDIGSVAATGSGYYSYVDVQPVKGGLLYYRVRGNDPDGQANYSRTVTVTLNSMSEGISVAPNPVGDQLLISFGAGRAGTYAMQLYSADGRLVYRGVVSVSDGQTVTLNRPADLNPGVYLLQLSDGHEKGSSFKLIFK